MFLNTCLCFVLLAFGSVSLDYFCRFYFPPFLHALQSSRVFLHCTLVIFGIYKLLGAVHLLGSDLIFYDLLGVSETIIAHRLFTLISEARPCSFFCTGPCESNIIPVCFVRATLAGCIVLFTYVLLSPLICM